MEIRNGEYYIWDKNPDGSFIPIPMAVRIFYTSPRMVGVFVLTSPTSIFRRAYQSLPDSAYQSTEVFSACHSPAPRIWQNWWFRMLWQEVPFFSTLAMWSYKKRGGRLCS